MKAKKTKTEKIIEHFTKRPGADVKAVAAKFDAAVPMVYKLRKRAHATTEANMALAEMLEMPPMPDPVKVARNADFDKPNAGRKITLNPAQVAIAKKFDIPLETFVKASLANGTLQYDDEKLPIDMECDECDEAEDTVDAILNNRAKQYGKFIEGAEIMQMTKRLIHNYIEQRGTSLAFDQLEAIDMIIHKLGRIINGNPDKVDHWDDIGGYATLVADRLKGKAR
jgi:hypothetical protein